MGSPLRLQVSVEARSALVDRAWREIRDEFEAAEDALSRFRARSEVHRLRLSGGRSTSPSRRLLAALAAADRARRTTDGRFDPRVLLALEGLGSQPLPLSAAAAEAGPVAVSEAARAEPIFRRIGRRHGAIDVPVPVDFGGIGKGLALRWAAHRANRVLGHWPFLLEAGGDLVADGSPAGHGWRIGIEPVGGQGPAAGPVGGAGSVAGSAAGPVAVLELPATGGAIATSSVRLAAWVTPDGRPAHHLIDPATGLPGGDGLLAVTVQARDAAWSEVWAKALFLAGAAGISSLARAKGLAAWWITAGGVLEMTPAARLRTLWVEAEPEAA
ncbi:MAG TPA: FAD:protein FMN transferase [Candidatus Limnocylindrales bacterium]|jgi:thiamine biosynthesis lipoprotein